ncbi:MAG: ParB N-terminal domain-containing protein [Pseudomonadota bacterium]
MRERQEFEIEAIYVPAKRARTLEADKVEALAEDMLEHGQKTPIQCRWDKKQSPPRLVLVEGYHRLEALRALGETKIAGYLVQARIR